MRKILIPVILLSLIAVAPLATGAVKAGGACKKVGQISIDAGKKYTCIKSGKKLIWNKGVAVQATQPNPTPSPTPTPTKPAPVVVEVKAGDGCQRSGDLEKNSAGPLECRAIVGEKLIWVQLSNAPGAVVNTTLSEDVSICKLQDLRTQKTPSQGVAFPLSTAGFSPLGEIRVAVIPFDFTDAPGEENLSSIIDSEKGKVDAWLAFNAKGKQKYSWTVVNEWIHLPKSSENYNSINPGRPIGVQVQSDSEIANQLFSAASSKLDLSKVDFVFLLFPKSQQGIGVEISGRTRPVSTPKGTFNLNYFGAGKIFPETNQPIWSIWVHEALHSQGLAMHAPGNGSPLHIGGNQSGASSNLSGWDQFISGWIDGPDIFCIQRENVSGQKFTLASTDKSDSGPKLAIIKISASEAIVIESRRRGAFSQGFPVGTYGLNAYVVQTAQNNERCDACDQDAIERKQFAYYLRADGVERGFFNFPMSAPIRWSVFIRQGESVTFGGVKVTLDATGDFDSIQVTKTS